MNASRRAGAFAGLAPEQTLQLVCRLVARVRAIEHSLHPVVWVDERSNVVLDEPLQACVRALNPGAATRALSVAVGLRGEHCAGDANDSDDRAEVAGLLRRSIRKVLLELGTNFVLDLDGKVDQSIYHRIAMEDFVTERFAQSCRQVSLFGFLPCWARTLAIAVGRVWDIPVAGAAPTTRHRTRRAWRVLFEISQGQQGHGRHGRHIPRVVCDLQNVRTHPNAHCSRTLALQFINAEK